jgi:GAF domain-containing protein
LIAITNGLNRKSGCPKKSPKRSRRRASFRCAAHVIANDEVLVVEDLARDRRFANNSLLKERGLRFYAGVPLRSNNLAIGSLCVLDLKPCRMTEREKRLLDVIAGDVMEEIQRRDSVGSLSAVACHQESNPSASTK